MCCNIFKCLSDLAGLRNSSLKQEGDVGSSEGPRQTDTSAQHQPSMVVDSASENIDQRQKQAHTSGSHPPPAMLQVNHSYSSSRSIRISKSGSSSSKSRASWCDDPAASVSEDMVVAGSSSSGYLTVSGPQQGSSGDQQLTGEQQTCAKQHNAAQQCYAQQHPGTAAGAQKEAQLQLEQWPWQGPTDSGIDDWTLVKDKHFSSVELRDTINARNNTAQWATLLELPLNSGSIQLSSGSLRIDLASATDFAAYLVASSMKRRDKATAAATATGAASGQSGLLSPLHEAAAAATNSSSEPQQRKQQLQAEQADLVRLLYGKACVSILDDTFDDATDSLSAVPLVYPYTNAAN